MIKTRKLQPVFFLLLFTFMAMTGFARLNPLCLHPENPHYFAYNGKPIILITSGEHYGAVMNTDFDYKIYLKTLQKDGLNLTRTMTGGYFEPDGAFKIAKNTLAPSPDKYICPWARAEDGKKFDLNQWNEAYFSRLKAFMAEAQKRGVIVELALFCPFYEELQWNLSPFNIKNNVNMLGDIPRTNVYTLDKSNGLLAIQKKMVRKIVEELKDFPNLIYEICNEPYFGGVTLAWQEDISKVIHDTEKLFASQHLISQNIANGSQKIENPNPFVSVFNFHYATPPVAVTINYHLKKVIGENETGFKGQKDSTYRKEAWELILAGGGLYNNLDYSFTSEHPNGSFRYPADQPGGGSLKLRKQLSYLKKFVESFNFITLKPGNPIYIGGLPGGLTPYLMAEAGKQYAFYLMGGSRINPEITLPKGFFSLEWMNPVNGKIEKKERLNHPGGKVKLTSPEYSEDIALKIIRIKK